MANSENKKKTAPKAPAQPNGSYKTDKRIARDKARKKSAKAASVKRMLIPVVAVVVAVALVVTGILVTYNVALNNGSIIRSNIAMETVDNKISCAMMSYYLHDEYHNYVKEIGGETYTSAYGLNTSKSLKNQNQSRSTTWFDYFLGLAMTKAENTLIMLEGAKRDGISLSADELNAVATAAAAVDASKYGKGVNNEDIRKAMELEALAEKYEAQLRSSIVITDEELEEYYEDHKDDFLRCDYLAYVIQYDLSSATTPASSAVASESSNEDTSEDASEVSSAAEVSETASEGASEDTSSTASEAESTLIGRDRAAAKALVNELEACTSEEEFLAKLEELFGADMTEDEIADMLADAKHTGLKPASGTTLNDWAFNKDTHLYDTKSVEDASTGEFTVYMLASEPARTDKPVVNAHVIVISKDDKDDDGNVTKSAKEKADEVLERFNSGDKTLDSFVALVNEYSEDETKAAGYYEAITYGAMEKNLNEWLYDGTRVSGDVAVVVEDDGCCNIVYFDEAGDAEWKYICQNDLWSEKYDEKYEDIEDNTRIVTHLNYMKSIPA